MCFWFQHLHFLHVIRPVFFSAFFISSPLPVHLPPDSVPHLPFQYASLCISNLVFVVVSSWQHTSLRYFLRFFICHWRVKCRSAYNNLPKHRHYCLASADISTLSSSSKYLAIHSPPYRIPDTPFIPCASFDTISHSLFHISNTLNQPS